MLVEVNVEQENIFEENGRSDESMKRRSMNFQIGALVELLIIPT